MRRADIPVCTICGKRKLHGDVWFLLAEDRWADRLKILEWHDAVACRQHVQRACCALHVQQLVVHWMTTGGLDHPFAMAHPADRIVASADSVWTLLYDADVRETRQIGELAVHRESVGRALRENPESLRVILDELFDALERVASKPAPDLELEEDEIISVLPRGV
jgi:hypothetical protein